MKTLVLSTALFASGCTHSDPNIFESLPTDPIDLEVKEAPAKDLYLLMEDITGRHFELEACENRTASLSLESVTPEVALRELALQLEARYSEDGDTVLVSCQT